MVIQVKRNWKDLIASGSAHQPLTRRNFLSRGLLTASISTVLPEFLLGAFSQNANATTSCPAQIGQPGAMAQIFRNGGNSRGAMFFTSQQANTMNATIASNYGIVGKSDLVAIGTNYWMAKTSPYAAGLMTAPPGYTTATWNAVMAKTSVSAIYGPWTADDGAGQQQGHLGAAGVWKPSVLGKDIRINNVDTLAGFGVGQPSVVVQTNTSTQNNSAFQAMGLTPTSIPNLLSFFPNNAEYSTKSNITPAQVTAAATAADSLTSAFATLFGTASRPGAATAVTKAVCGFYGDAVLANPSFGNGLFNPANISALSSGKVPLTSLTAQQQALLGAFYASAVGNCGAVIIEHAANDYHGTNASNVAQVDFEAGQILQMFIAACDVAQQPGVFIDVSNGNCANSGTDSTTVNGIAVNSPGMPGGDAGGSFNAGYILFYNPTVSALPTLITPPGISSLDTGSGNVSPPSNIAAPAAATAWLYLSAIQYLSKGSGSTLDAAYKQMVAAGALPSGFTAAQFSLIG